MQTYVYLSGSFSQLQFLPVTLLTAAVLGKKDVKVALLARRFLTCMSQSNAGTSFSVAVCYARLLPKIYMHNTVELNIQPTAM